MKLKSKGSSGESFFVKSEFLDPLVRINKMKRMTSEEIGVAFQCRFACVDLRVRKQPKLTEIFNTSNTNLPHSAYPVPVVELNVTHGQRLRESSFAAFTKYHLVLVLSNSLDLEYPGKEEERQLYNAVNSALKKRSHVSLLHGGAKELFRVYGEIRKA